MAIRIRPGFCAGLLMLGLVASCCTTIAMAADETAELVAAREKAFVEQMSNCVLIGSFTVDGKSDGDPLKEERYEIDSVSSAGGDLWIFMTRVKYGKIDTKLPITVPVKWAGETPMVSLTNATLPGLGSEFSARVLFHENRYAGTWQHGKVGGHMFGRIEKREAPPTNPETKPAADKKQ